MKEIYSEAGVTLAPAASLSADLVKVALEGGMGLGGKAVDQLIQSSQVEAQADIQAPFEFVSRFGMPNSEVWAMTRDGSAIEPHLPAVIAHARHALETSRPQLG